MELYLLPVPDRWHALHSRTHEDARGGPTYCLHRTAASVELLESGLAAAQAPFAY